MELLRTDLVQHAQDVLLALRHQHVITVTEGADVEPGLEAESEQRNGMFT